MYCTKPWVGSWSCGWLLALADWKGVLEQKEGREADCEEVEFGDEVGRAVVVDQVVRYSCCCGE